jgi:hypothetical protein
MNYAEDRHIPGRNENGVVVIGQSASVIDSSAKIKKGVPIEDLLKRIELLEIKAENFEVKYNQLERYVLSLPKPFTL